MNYSLCPTLSYTVLFLLTKKIKIKFAVRNNQLKVTQLFCTIKQQIHDNSDQ